MTPTLSAPNMWPRGTHDIRGGAVHLELAGRDPQQVTVMGLAPAEVRLEVLVYAVNVGSR